MKMFFKILSIVFVLCVSVYIFYDTTTNKTEVGYFWCYGKYCEDIKPSQKDIDAYNCKLMQFQHAFIYNQKQVVTIYGMVANDPSYYYKGIAKMRNDTLFLDLEQVNRLTYYFDTEMKACCSLFQFYFTSDVIPKTIYIGDKPIGSVPNQVSL